MAWNYDRSIKRIKDHLARLQNIAVEKLVREADLATLLSETNCRQIYGSHTYVTVSNFAQLASDGLYAADDYKRLIQGVHIYQREITRIVERAEAFDALRVHFQGPKLHALCYRPIDNSETLATYAVLLQLVIKDFVKSVFNPAFPHYENFIVSAGSALGEVIGTKNGQRGDQEMLFIGAPANYAAKIIGSWGSLRIDGATYDALPSALQDLCVPVRDGVYRIATPSTEVLDALLDEYGIAWNPEDSADRVQDDKERFPLKDIGYSDADVLIDLEALSIHNNKRVFAASVFADIAGFTRYIDDATTTDDKIVAVRVLHAIRKEMATVIRNDFGGLRIQYQGDRAQGLFHLPKNDAESIATTAVDAAIGLQSSMEHAIKEVLPEAKDLSLAVGVDMGTTLVSRLGTRGQRDRICIGAPVEEAARCEESCAGGEIGITKTVYESLSENQRAHFTYAADRECYVSANLTSEKMARAARASVYAGSAVYLQSTNQGVRVSREELADARRVTPSRCWAS